METLTTAPDQAPTFGSPVTYRGSLVDQVGSLGWTVFGSCDCRECWDLDLSRWELVRGTELLRHVRRTSFTLNPTDPK